MDRGVPAEFVDGCLAVAAAVAVAAVGEPVWPGGQHLPTPVRGTFVDPEAIDHIQAVDRAAAQGGADLGDLRLGVAVGDGVLVA